jgi:hypothetical protein
MTTTIETVDIGWLLFCAALVLVMQAGFTALESGLVRSKNSICRVAFSDGADTALGDTVNIAARLTGEAGAGEVLISSELAAAGGLETTSLERRRLELRGRDQSVDAWVVRPSG